MKVGDKVLIVGTYMTLMTTIQRISTARITTADGRKWSRKTMREIGGTGYVWLRVPTEADMIQHELEERRRKNVLRIDVALRGYHLLGDEQLDRLAEFIEKLVEK